MSITVDCRKYITQIHIKPSTGAKIEALCEEIENELTNEFIIVSRIAVSSKLLSLGLKSIKGKKELQNEKAKS